MEFVGTLTQSFLMRKPSLILFHPKYDHFAFKEIDKATWSRIIEQLDITRAYYEGDPKPEEIDDYIDFIFVNSRQEFVDVNQNGDYYGKSWSHYSLL